MEFVGRTVISIPSPTAEKLVTLCLNQENNIFYYRYEKKTITAETLKKKYNRYNKYFQTESIYNQRYIWAC